ncbi:MAG: four helix bundle protein [Comamonadaceae bacterium]|nr:four helix bundle protein [Comamonadaceae bacterium]
MKERAHRQLPLWKASMELVEAFYFVTQSFPRDEQFGLTSQIRRAVVSVPANIAEGAARKGTSELLQFLYIANGSLSELDTHLEIAHRLGYLADPSRLQQQLDAVQSQLLSVIASLKRRSR